MQWPDRIHVKRQMHTLAAVRRLRHRTPRDRDGSDPYLRMVTCRATVGFFYGTMKMRNMCIAMCMRFAAVGCD